MNILLNKPSVKQCVSLRTPAGGEGALFKHRGTENTEGHRGREGADVVAAGELIEGAVRGRRAAGDNRPHRSPSTHNFQERGSVLIIVMVVCIGLVSVAIYFANSTAMAYRGSASDLAGRQAQRAIDGAAQYAESLVISATANSGAGGGGAAGVAATIPVATGSGSGSSTSGSSGAYVLPDPMSYQSEAVPVGDAAFWFIGNPETTPPASTATAGMGSTVPTFGLVDEASKLNLNTATAAMLQNLPNMTPALAQAIVAWRKSNNSSSSSTTLQTDSTAGGTSKGGPFESIYELAQLVQADGDDPSILYGNDTNLNHVLDGSESQGATQYTPGIYNYVTVFSREPNIMPGTGQSRINITTGSAAVSTATTTDSNNNLGTSGASSYASAPKTLNALLSNLLGPNRALEVIANVASSFAAGGSGGGRGGGGGRLRSVLEFYIRGKLTAAELDQLTPYLTMSTGNYKTGLINVNTASATVLACVPGITPEMATQIVSARQSQATPYTNLSFVATILGNTAAFRAGPYLTTETFQVSADIAAVGTGGLGYRRTLFVIDASNGAPQIVYRRDMTSLGWALGPGALSSLGTNGKTNLTTR